MSAILTIENLNLSIGGNPILKDISFKLHKGKITGLVGESGSGKSLTALSVMRLLPEASKLTGAIDFNNIDLINADEEEMCALRGDDIGMVFQEPMTALNPLKTIGDQVAEGIQIHAGVSKKTALERAANILTRVGLPQDEYSLDRYPHELSGGQRQRVVIAIACAMNPKLLIADEPTTALDVLVQRDILNLLQELVEENNMALLLISHDLGVVAEMSDEIIIMRSGEIMEQGPAIKLLKEQAHPYTNQLAIASQHVPKKIAHEKTGSSVLVKIQNLVCEYKRPRINLFQKRTPFQAVKSINFEIYEKQILGLVGESGCGKSTLSRALLGLHPPASGRIEFSHKYAQQNTASFVQAIFQDPYGSFNPRHTAERLVSEALFLNHELSAKQKLDKTVQALEVVGLKSSDLDKYPHQFSGGQRQRLAFSRAIVSDPKLIIADEPVSALDVSIRAQILDLIIELRERLDVAWLFVSHDLSVVKVLCDDVLVMKEGKIVEYGAVEQIYQNASHPYTKQIISAAPILNEIIKRKS